MYVYGGSRSVPGRDASSETKTTPRPGCLLIDLELGAAPDQK